jgi:ABC-type nitrate/sulfonate/bicarbonate transport system permease component
MSALPQTPEPTAQGSVRLTSQSGGGRRSASLGLGALSLLGLLILWFAVSALQPPDQRWLPSPVEIVQHMWALVIDGYRGTSLIVHVLVSIRRTAIGFLLAIVLGVPLGLAMGRSRTLGELLGPIFSLLRPIPPIAFIPLAVLYLGLGEASKVVLIFLAPFLFIVLNSEAGVRTVPHILIRAGEMLGLSNRQLFTRVVLPGAMPSILIGIRTGAAVSWALVVAAELLSAQEGLGYMVASAGNFFDLKTVYVGIILIGVIGFALDVAARAIERRLLHWQGR